MAEPKTNGRLRTQEKPEQEGVVESPLTVQVVDGTPLIGACEIWVEEKTDSRDVVSRRGQDTTIWFQHAQIVFPDGARPVFLDLRIEDEHSAYAPGVYKLSCESLGANQYRAIQINPFRLGLVRVGDLPDGFNSSLTTLGSRL